MTNASERVSAQVLNTSERVTAQVFGLSLTAICGPVDPERHFFLKREPGGTRQCQFSPFC
jgi:hypothetical protein